MLNYRVNDKQKLYGLKQEMPEGMAYYFILVPEVKEKKFLGALKTDEPFTLDDFGDVIYCEYTPPTKELLVELENRYKVEFLE